MEKELSDVTDNNKFKGCEHLEPGLKLIGRSICVDTDVTLKEVITFKASPFRYLGQLKRELDDFIIGQFRKYEY